LTSPASSAVVVVSLLLLFLPAGLAGFHTCVGALLPRFLHCRNSARSYLVVLNRTTNEHLKSVYAVSPNPFDVGCTGNMHHICCSE
jgi:hypothetical protein